MLKDKLKESMATQKALVTNAVAENRAMTEAEQQKLQKKWSKT